MNRRFFFGLLLILAPSLLARADDAPKSRSRRVPVNLWPPKSDQDLARLADAAFELDGWLYRVQKLGDSHDGVPWEIIVTPTEENAPKWRLSESTGLPRVKTAMPGPGAARDLDAVPAAPIPDHLWKKWMSPELVGDKQASVVGVHFHGLASDGLAGLLFTLHKLPADGPDGKPPSGYTGRRGTRIEATLLAPIAYALDQAIVVREDPLRKNLTPGRIEHELSHAALSQELLPQVLAGPQNWRAERCDGQRSRLVYYWRRERVGRPWDGYRGGSSELATLRTIIMLVPPTRWSILLPVPPERVTQKMLQSFNDSIVLTGPRFEDLDSAAQARFHAEHGAFEKPEQKQP